MEVEKAIQKTIIKKQTNVLKSQVNMNYLESLKNYLRNDEEEPTGKFPEMTEIRIGSHEGPAFTSVRVAQSWGSLLEEKSRNASFADAHSDKEASIESGSASKGNLVAETLDLEEDLLDNWSSEAVGGSGKKGQSQSPMPDMKNDFHWQSLRFGSGTYGKLDLISSTMRCWNGINLVDKRSLVMRMFLLDLEEKLKSSDESQSLLWENFEMHEIANREMFSKLEEDHSRLKSENEELKKEMAKLRKEHNKTKDVLFNVIAFMKDGLNNSPNMAKLDQEVPENKGSNQNTGGIPTPISLKAKEVTPVLKQEQSPIKSNAKETEPRDDNESVVVEEKASEVEDEVREEEDLMAFLNVPLMNPITRRRLIAERKIPKPSPNKDALTSLPKYSGPNERRSTEETQRITLSWLSSVEGVILSQDAMVQDVYDKLPFLLEENAGVWFRQSCIKSGHFKTWNDFRQALLKVFLGPDWKHDLERTFNTIRQEEKEPGVNFVLRVWSLAKQIDPAYPEDAILAKIATAMKPKLWNRIPRTERQDYFSLVEVVAVYDEDGYSRRPATLEENFRKQPKQTFPKPVPYPSTEKKVSRCYICQKEGHMARNCPSKRLVASTSKVDAKHYASGKGKGASLGTK